LIASFIAAPAPTGPTWSARRHNCSITGSAPAASSPAPRTADHAEQLAVACRYHRAADRAFDKRATRRANLVGQFLCGLRQYGAHFDDQGIAEIGRQQSAIAFVDGLHRRVVDQHDDHRLAHGGKVGRARRQRRTFIDQRLRPARRAVPHRQRLAATD
jgi:hypothetical protein